VKSHSPEFLIRFGLLLAALVAAVIIVYLPGLTGPLLFDDYTNLSPLGADGGVTDWVSFRNFVFGNASGPSGRPVSMLSFLIDAQNWPPYIAAFKYTNILIHLLNGLLLCWLSIELFQVLGLSTQRSSMFGLLVAALWLLHPLNVSTTLYVVQRMTQLMTLFGLASLLCFVKGRQLVLVSPKTGLLLLGLCLFPFALLSVLSKENGSLLLLLVLVFEFSIFQTKTSNQALRVWLLIGVWLPLAVLGAYLLLTFPAAMDRYEFRHFSFLERILTESRVLLAYVREIFIPNGASLGLFHDDIAVSTSLTQPLSTVLSILSLLALGWSACVFRKSQPMLFFGIAWFFAMHLLESSYLPLELYFEHRNYMSMIGPLICSLWYLHCLLQGSSPQYWKQAGMSVAVVFLLSSGWTSWQQARLWGHTGNLYAHWAENQPESNRAQLAYADFLSINGEPEQGLTLLARAHEIYPKEATTMLHMWNNACQYGLQPPINIEQIANMDGLEYFHNDINFHLTALLENLLLNKCSYPEPQIVVSLFERVAALELADDRRASFHALYSDLFVHYRQLNPALIQLRNAFDLNPIPQFPIRQALISASAGNNADALVFLERARAADKQQSLLLPSVEEEIARIEADITARMNGQ